MNREEMDKTLEEWLDRAAADYGKSDIRPGFEARIIANLNSTRKEQQNRRIPWIAVWATATAILILAVGGSLLTKFQGPDRTQIALKKPARPALAFPGVSQQWPMKVIGKEPKSESASARQRSTQDPRGIVRKRFLSSQLTDQERYLIAYAGIVSKSTMDAVEEDEFTPTEIPLPSAPPLYVPELESFSVEKKDLQIPKLQYEEQL
jgi:hypothetical protein